MFSVLDAILYTFAMWLKSLGITDLVLKFLKPDFFVRLTLRGVKFINILARNFSQYTKAYVGQICVWQTVKKFGELLRCFSLTI